MKKAFTLIELLIVITVIAILAGILVPSFRSYQNEAWHVKAEGDISSLQLAVESFFRQNDNRFPDGLGELITVSPRYIPNLPKDPYRTNGVNYGYEIVTKKPGSETFYVLYSNGTNHVRDWKWDEKEGSVILSDKSDDVVFTNAMIGSLAEAK
ncbi:MAG: type II secretion system protein [Candidatus Margulisiibacteriota bacterium]